MSATSRYYDPKEEFWNVVTHAFGLLLSVIGLIALVMHASLYGSVWHIVSFSIYGASLVILYTASTVYHMSRRPKLRIRLNVFDHAAIFVLIAGTYTPYLLITLRGPWGWSLLGVIWGIAVAGVLVKLFYAGRHDKLSTIAYVGMGWLAVIAFYPLMRNLSGLGMFWLLAGGGFYSIGAVLYMRKNMAFNHAIFHVFVLLGSISHFISIFFYV